MCGWEPAALKTEKEGMCDCSRLFKLSPPLLPPCLHSRPDLLTTYPLARTTTNRTTIGAVKTSRRQNEIGASVARPAGETPVLALRQQQAGHRRGGGRPRDRQRSLCRLSWSTERARRRRRQQQLQKEPPRPTLRARFPPSRRLPTRGRGQRLEEMLAQTVSPGAATIQGAATAPPTLQTRRRRTRPT